MGKNKKTLYEILGVDANATKEDLKKQYRKLAIQNHPDKGGDPDVFKEIAHAYDVLSDDEKRRHYDLTGDDSAAGPGGGGGGGPGGPFANPHEIFEHFFRSAGMDPFGHFSGMPHERRPPTPAKCADSMHRIHISLKDAFFGCTKQIKVSLHKPCMQCKEKCFACQGKGSITNIRRMGVFTQMMTQPCQDCQGKGIVFKGRTACAFCEGKGEKQEQHVLEWVLPPGVEHGHRKVFKGMGEQSSTENTLSGDLILEMSVAQQENGFTRHGNDLHCKSSISFLQSMTGANISIDHFKGPLVMNTATTFGVIQPNHPYVLAKKGMPIRGSAAPSDFGNLVITFDIDYPKQPLPSDLRDQLKLVWQQHQHQHQ